MVGIIQDIFSKSHSEFYDTGYYLLKVLTKSLSRPDQAITSIVPAYTKYITI